MTDNLMPDLKTYPAIANDNQSNLLPLLSYQLKR